MTEYTFYQIECNGKRYVGHTKDFDKRKWQHEYSSSNVKSTNYTQPVYQYIRANGNWSNCQILILEICNLETKRDAEMREEYWRIEIDATLNSHRCYITNEIRLEKARERANIRRIENPEIEKQNKKKWYKKNKTEVAKYKIIWYEKNKTEVVEYKKTWYEKNKNKILQKQKQERLKKKMLLELLHRLSHSTNYTC